MKTVLIAEKPSVGKAITKHLPGPHKMRSGYVGARGPTHIAYGGGVVTWVFGHILEAVEPHEYDPALKKWRKSTLPIVTEHWKLKPVPSSIGQFHLINELIRDADLIIHAGDPDREGQLLVDEVLYELRNRVPVKRIWLAALDDASIRKALNSLEDNQQYHNLYQAALGRQRADWLVGLNMTRARRPSDGEIPTENDDCHFSDQSGSWFASVKRTGQVN